MTKPCPSTITADECDPAILHEAELGDPSTRPPGSSSVEIARTRTPSTNRGDVERPLADRSPDRRELQVALAAGQDRLWIARVIVNPAPTI